VKSKVAIGHILLQAISEIGATTMASPYGVVLKTRYAAPSIIYLGMFGRISRDLGAF
jgi:hypothetical protein